MNRSSNTLRRMSCSPRWRTLLALTAATLVIAGPLAAQQPPDTGRGPPLRADPGDWWGDVHRWTGSDETRPRGGRPADAPGSATPSPGQRRAAPSAEGRRTAVTSANRRTNVRQAPSLEAPVVRTIAPNTIVNVFEDGPDGWYQVGEDTPLGWMHRSTMQRPPAAERP
ncbi:SH3 domain-containing protein [Roseomonas sp. JC162]|uniref:SH3 domain-containing protein n=1 Tax=Neoroseomonas marina TaxID=1232220 RepID=A0A848EGI0_9PROT|nr:SH3 domain-containing protein [Neoroseomonas marina]NMJ43764.1 SH3 domain-containing protein [Neoroseomonas marina]